MMHGDRLAKLDLKDACLTANSKSQVTPEIPTIPVGRQTVAIPDPPLCPEQCPLHLCQVHDAHSSYSEAARNPADTPP